MQILGSEICTAHNGPSVPVQGLPGGGGRGQTSQLLIQRPSPPDLWSYGLSPAVPAASYETFDPAVATFSHTQGVQLCYGPSTYSPVGNLDPAPSLEAPGPGFPAYPMEDFTSQVRGRVTMKIPIIRLRFPRCQALHQNLCTQEPLHPSDDPLRL